MTARESSEVKIGAELARTRDESLAPSVALPWIVQLRFLLVAGETALVVFLSTEGGAGTWAWCGSAIAAQLAANLWLVGRAQRRGADSEHVLGAVFALDALALTVVFGFTGGPNNPFTLLYLVQITLSAVILHRSWTWALGLLSTICYGSLFLLATVMSSRGPAEMSDMMARHVTGMWFAFALAAGVLTFFIGQVSETLQRRQQEVLALQKQVSRQERLASLVTLAGGAAHEMSTPLGTIAVAAREIERAAEVRLQDADLTDDARLIRTQVERCREILADMSAKGAEPPGEAPVRVSIGEVLERVTRSLPLTLQARVTVDQKQSEVEWKTFSATAVQSITALVRNALDASPGGQPVGLEARATANTIVFVVRDHGEGMDAEALARVVEPFFTLKPQGEGMGLGAFLAHLFAARVGGELRYESRLGEGTTAYLTLPRGL